MLILSVILFVWVSHPPPSCACTTQHSPTSKHPTLHRANLWVKIIAPNHLMHGQMTRTSRDEKITVTQYLFIPSRHGYTHFSICCRRPAHSQHHTWVKTVERWVRTFALQVLQWKNSTGSEVKLVSSLPQFYKYRGFVQNQIPVDLQPQVASGQSDLLVFSTHAWNWWTLPVPFSVCLKGTRWRPLFLF